MATLILLRHGQSLWNLQNRFTGWVDVDLSEQGIQEAQQAGEKLKNTKMIKFLSGRTALSNQATYWQPRSVKRCYARISVNRDRDGLNTQIKYKNVMTQNMN